MTWRLPGGIVLIVLGAFLAVRPFTALIVLQGLTAVVLIAGGFALLGQGRRWRLAPKVRAALPGWLEHTYPIRAGLGLVLAGAGVAAVVWPRVTFAALSYLPLLIALAAGGIYLWRFAAALQREQRPAPAHLVLGLSAVLLALAGWRWPDVVLMLLAFTTGIAILAAGVLIARRPHRPPPRPRRAPRRVHRAGLVLALPAAFGMTLLSGYLGSHSSPDEFYTPPGDVPGTPGQLLRSEPVPAPAGANGARILYTTTLDDTGTPALASAVVIWPEGTTEAPVIAWAHGTTGQVRGCAPSLTSLEAGAMLVTDDILRAGWALIAPDYPGLGAEGPHPYLIGQGEARSVIDAVRAVGQDSDLPLATGTTALWGHSQGGHAALWAAGLWDDYAPEVPLAGVAALAPAANIPEILQGWEQGKITNIFSAYALAAYSRAYDDVDAGDYIRPAAAATARAFASRCLDDPGTVVSLTASLTQESTIWSGGDLTGSLRERALQNVPTIAPRAPVLIAQGENDTAIPRQVQDDYVAGRCAQGWDVDYRTYPGLDHMPLVEPDSEAIDDVFLWTATLFAGQSVPPGTC